MDPYILVIKNEKIKLYDRFGWFIVLLNLVALIYTLTVKDGVDGLKWALFIFFLTLVVFIVYKKKIFHPVERRRKFSILLLLIYGLTWTFLDLYWPLIINVILIVLSTIATRTLDITFASKKIIYPSFPRRNINWNELSNVILKDGLLTMDFKNNKLMQAEVVNDKNDYNVNEKEFNNFCKQQLNK
jgi:hypothetical protein